ncbi:MAG: hypothetical protein ACJAYU_004019, partial [Bradymonadia bacterium]
MVAAGSLSGASSHTDDEIRVRDQRSAHRNELESSGHRAVEILLTDHATEQDDGNVYGCDEL